MSLSMDSIQLQELWFTTGDGRVRGGVEKDPLIFYLFFFFLRDFDSLLYLCEGAFKFLPTDMYSRLTTGVVFPCYVVSLVAVLCLLAYTVFVNWR